MSRFYGSVTSDKGQSTRAGHHWIRATAQSFEGSASVAVSHGTHDPYKKDAPLFLTIRVAEGTTDVPDTLVFEAPLADVLALAKAGGKLRS